MNKAIKKAKEELQEAWQNFNYADEDFRDIAILQVNACMNNLSRLLKEQKNLIRERGEEYESNF